MSEPHSYLFIGSQTETPKVAQWAREIRGGVWLISDERDFITLHIAMANVGEAGPEFALLQLAYPSEALGISQTLKAQWDMAMGGVMRQAVQSVREATIRAFRERDQEKTEE